MSWVCFLLPFSLSLTHKCTNASHHKSPLSHRADPEVCNGDEVWAEQTCRGRCLSHRHQRTIGKLLLRRADPVQFQAGASGGCHVVVDPCFGLRLGFFQGHFIGLQGMMGPLGWIKCLADPNTQTGLDDWISRATHMTFIPPRIQLTCKLHILWSEHGAVVGQGWHSPETKPRRSVWDFFPTPEPLSCPVGRVQRLKGFSHCVTQKHG